jgi:hypothetical protein
MAAEMPVPVCEVTGLPHLVLPYNSTRQEVQPENFDHSWYPRMSPELQDDAGIALRMSRGQMLPMWLHERKHQTLTGPQLPTVRAAKFEAAVKGCAGVASRWAIDLRIGGDDKLVYMDDETFNRVTDRRSVGIERAWYHRPANYRRGVIGDFFIRYALEQDLSHISLVLIDEFLSTTDEKRKKELGNFMLKEALDISLEPIVPIHRSLRAEGCVQSGRPDVTTVVRKFLRKSTLPMYHEPLAEKLRLAA